MKKLKDKVTIITGGAQGIGLATAHLFPAIQIIDGGMHLS